MEVDGKTGQDEKWTSRESLGWYVPVQGHRETGMEGVRSALALTTIQRAGPCLYDR